MQIREHSPYTLTLEAFADTIVPGERRSPDERAIAGVASGPGAVAAGALEVLHHSAPGIDQGLESLVTMANQHARRYASDRGMSLDDGLPPFVALSYQDRYALVSELTAPTHPEKDGWVLLALFCNMAFDSAPHKHTAEAIAEGHPGLRTLGFTKPDSDGLWRFPNFSYGRKLAERHPNTTDSGSPR
jgi:enediyne biosynthesis protein E8